jgi:hypothetical protein
MRAAIIAAFLFSCLLFYGCLGDEDEIYWDIDTETDNQNTDSSNSNEPTWEEPIKKIMTDQCASCHSEEVKTYSNILKWVNNGMLKQYTEQEHYINGDDKDITLHWLDIGAPETSADIEERQ